MRRVTQISLVGWVVAGSSLFAQSPTPLPAPDFPAAKAPVEITLPAPVGGLPTLPPLLASPPPGIPPIAPIAAVVPIPAPVNATKVSTTAPMTLPAPDL